MLCARGMLDQHREADQAPAQSINVLRGCIAAEARSPCLVLICSDLAAAAKLLSGLLQLPFGGGGGRQRGDKHSEQEQESKASGQQTAAVEVLQGQRVGQG